MEKPTLEGALGRVFAARDLRASAGGTADVLEDAIVLAEFILRSEGLRFEHGVLMREPFLVNRVFES